MVMFPRIGEFLYIEQEVVGTFANTGIQTLHFFLNQTDEKGSVRRHRTIVPFPLLTGEWYKIKSIYYLPKNDSTYAGYPIITLGINRSEKERRWIKDRITSMGHNLLDLTDIENCISAICKDINIYAVGRDLNGRACTTTKPDAIYRRNSRSAESHTPVSTQRFKSILSS